MWLEGMLEEVLLNQKIFELTKKDRTWSFSTFITSNPTRDVSSSGTEFDLIFNRAVGIDFSRSTLCKRVGSVETCLAFDFALIAYQHPKCLGLAPQS